MMVEALVLYAAGVITGPVLKSVVRGTVKGTIKAGMRVKQLASDAATEVKGLASEAGNDMAKPIPATVSAKK